MTTSVAPPRVLSNKATLMGVAVPTPTRKDGTPIPLADTPPQGFHKAKVPTNAPPPVSAAVEASPPAVHPSEAPKVEPRVLTQQAIDAIKATSQPTAPEKVDASTRVTRRDMPIQGARRPMPEPPSGLSSSTRLLAVSAALAVLVLGGRWAFLRQRPSDDTKTPAPAAPTGVQVVPPTEQAAAGPAAPSPAATETGAAEPDQPATPAASASAEPAPATSAEPGSAARPEGTRVVIVKLSPPEARLYRKGKSVGSSPVTIELGPNEKKRSFEVGMPGYVTRKLVVDGSKPEIFIGLKPR